MTAAMNTTDEAAARTLTTLRFLTNARQGEERDATGCHGFFYHFLDMGSGRRAWDCEVSTIDTAYLMAGALVAAAYFDGEAREEREIRKTADALYRRCDFTWALNGALLLSQGWKPEGGFLKRCWTGYSEALVLYLLALITATRWWKVGRRRDVVSLLLFPAFVLCFEVFFEPQYRFWYPTLLLILPMAVEALSSDTYGWVMGSRAAVPGAGTAGDAAPPVLTESTRSAVPLDKRQGQT